MHKAGHPVKSQGKAVLLFFFLPEDSRASLRPAFPQLRIAKSGQPCGVQQKLRSL